MTVILHNLGGGWLEVSGGGGSVSVSPGPQPSSGGGEEGEPEPPPSLGVYTFEVLGLLGPGSGDVTWSGDAAGLYIQASGDVSSFSISGSATVTAGYSVGNVSGLSVAVLAGTSTGDISATDDVVRVMAGGSVGAVTAGGDVGEVTVGGDLGAVQAAGNVTRLSVGGNTSSVSAGSWIGTVSAGLDVGGAVTAGTYIGGAYVPGAGDDFWAWYSATYHSGVSAGRDVTGPVTAGRSIAEVTAGRDVLGAVHAQGEDVWLVRAGGGGYPRDGGTFIPYEPGRVLGTVTAARDITSVVATGNVLGKVTAQAGFVFAVNADGSVLGGVEAATDIGRQTIREADPDWRSSYWNPFPQDSGSESWVPLGAGVIAETGDVDGVVRAATGSIRGQVRAGRDVLSSQITAGQNIGPDDGDIIPADEGYGSGVHAGRTMAAAVSAGIDVETVSAGVLVSGSVTAGRDVGAVTASGMVPGVGLRPEAGDVTGPVLAGRNLSSVWANHDILGSLTASTGGIRRIWAGRDLGGAATAGEGLGYLPGEMPPWDVPFVYGPIPPQIEAGRDITGNLTAQTGNIGWVKESTGSSYALYGGGVLAGRHIDGDVHSLLGGIAQVLAGARFLEHGANGHLSGDVTAKKYDLTVTATGDVLGSVQAGWGVQLTSGGSVTGLKVNAPGGNAEVIASVRVDSTIFGRDAVFVKAGASVAGSVTAGDDDHWATAEVLAAEDVSAPVIASGPAYVVTTGAVTGTVTGVGDVLVDAREDVTGAIKSLGGAVAVTTAGSVSGTVTALDVVTITAGGSVSSSVTAGDLAADSWGWADIDAGGDVTGSVSAAGGAWVSADGAVSGAITTVINEAVVTARGAVTGAVTGDYAHVAGSSIEAPVTGVLGVEARALGDILGALTSEGGAVMAWAGRNVNAPVLAKLEVYLEAGGEVSGVVVAGDPDTRANALVRAAGNVSGDVRASADAEVWAGGDILGDVLAGEGEAIALAVGMVRGAVRSDLDQLRVWAAQGTGRYSGGSSGADWLMVLTNRDGADLLGSLIARDPAGPAYVAATLFDPPPAPVGPNGDRDQVLLAADELAREPRMPRPPAADTPADDLPIEPRSDWTWEGYLWRASELTRWWRELDGDRLEALQDWWADASNAERWQFLKDMLQHYSKSDWDMELDRRIDPPAEIPPPPPAVGPPAQTGPSDAVLKAWEKETSDSLKASAAAADGKIKNYDEEGTRRVAWHRSYFKQALRLELAKGETAEVKELRGWAQQVSDRINFDVTADGKPIPRTEEGKRQAEALKQEVEELKFITSMPLDKRFGAAIQRALNAKDAQGNNKLAGELRDAVLELVKPESLAIMASVFGVVGLSTLTPAGPFVVGAVGIFGYIMTGKTVIDVGYDGYMFISITAGARRPQDLDKAADHFISAAKTLATEGAGAVLGIGAAKVGKGLTKLKGVAGKADDVKKMAVRRGDGKVQINDGSPPPSAGGADAAAHASTNPVPPAKPPSKPRFTARPAPAGLSEAAQAVWKSLDEMLGKDVMDPFVNWVAKDGTDLEQALNKLKSVLEKTIANPSQASNVGARWAKWTHLTTTSVKRPHLKDVFGNSFLQDELEAGGRTLMELLTDLDKIAHLPGAPGAFKTLATKKDSVKGVLAEIRLAAQDMPDTVGVKMKFTTGIDDTTVKLSDGTELEIPKGTDADVVSKGTLWQVKVGEFAVDNPGVYEAWLRQAAEAVRAKSVPGGTKVGLRLDSPNAKLFGIDNNGAFERNTNYKKMWERVTEAYPDVEFIIDKPIQYP